jgi:hypothetical protein
MTSASRSPSPATPPRKLSTSPPASRTRLASQPTAATRTLLAASLPLTAAGQSQVSNQVRAGALFTLRYHVVPSSASAGDSFPLRHHVVLPSRGRAWGARNALGLPRDSFPLRYHHVVQPSRGRVIPAPAGIKRKLREERDRKPTGPRIPPLTVQMALNKVYKHRVWVTQKAHTNQNPSPTRTLGHGKRTRSDLARL